jgi:choice-of-anchor B domain-containing protein
MITRREAAVLSPARCLSAVAALALVAGIAVSHDEDWRKLADREAPVWGPMQTQVTGFAEGDTFDADGVICNAWIPLNQFGLNSTSGNDCWGYTSPSGREYAIMGLSNGYGFVEITDPNNPVILNSISGPSSDWHDIKVVGEYAYGVSEGGAGIQVIDLRNIDSGSVSLVGNISTAGHSTTHNIIVNEDSGALYICGANIGNGGLLRVDLSNPRSPSIVGGWTQMYVHDAQVITPSSGPYAGREIAFCASGFSSGIVSTGLRIVDITNPAAPVTLSTLFYPNAGYSHQAWLSDDRTTLYLNDELDEDNGLVSQTTTRVIDVSDFTSPSFVGNFSSGRASIDHNLYVKDGYIYQANYRSGLRVFDAADKLNPVEIAYFDTYPGSDSADFNGAWSNYPYFDSDTVIVSDIERGLFVLTVSAIGDRLRLDLDGTAPTLVSPDGGDQIQVEIIEQGLTLDPSTVEMVVSQGDGIQQVAASSLGGGLYGFTFPPLDCDSDASFYFTATATDGSSYTLPNNAPGEQYTVTVASDQIAGFGDNFQTNQGWTVNSTASDGQWQRAIPADASRGAPASDFDGSGFCYVTDNAAGNSDVDSGFTRLTSPAFDLSGGGIVSYAYWLNDVSNGNLSANDNLVVEFSGNNGGSWTEVARYLSAASSWRTADLVIDGSLAGAQSRVRFTVNDDDPQGVVEAAIDAFSTSRLVCEPTANCVADLAAPFGELTFADISTFLAAFANQDRVADLAAPFGQYTFADISAFLAAFSAGCP